MGNRKFYQLKAVRSGIIPVVVVYCIFQLEQADTMVKAFCASFDHRQLPTTHTTE